MYRDLSRGWAALNRTAHSLAWLMVVGAGLAAFFLPPNSISDDQPGWMSVVWPLVALFGAGGATVGAFRGDYWLEASSAFLGASGASIYAATVWMMVLDGQETRLTQAFMLTACVVFMGSRIVSCFTQAHRVRKAFENPPEV